MISSYSGHVVNNEWDSLIIVTSFKFPNTNPVHEPKLKLYALPRRGKVPGPTRDLQSARHVVQPSVSEDTGSG